MWLLFECLFRKKYTRSYKDVMSLGGSRGFVVAFGQIVAQGCARPHVLLYTNIDTLPTYNEAKLQLIGHQSAYSVQIFSQPSLHVVAHCSASSNFSTSIEHRRESSLYPFMMTIIRFHHKKPSPSKAPNLALRFDWLRRRWIQVQPWQSLASLYKSREALPCTINIRESVIKIYKHFESLFGGLNMSLQFYIQFSRSLAWRAI